MLISNSKTYEKIKLLFIKRILKRNTNKKLQKSARQDLEFGRRVRKYLFMISMRDMDNVSNRIIHVWQHLSYQKMWVQMYEKKPDKS